MSSPSRPRSVRSQPETLVRATLDLGLPAMLQYGAYRLDLRTGWLRRRTPVRAWVDLPLAAWLRPGIAGDPQGYLAYRRGRPRLLAEATGERSAALSVALEASRPAVMTEADEILRGEFRLFGGPARRLGFPPDWGAFAAEPADSPSARLDLDQHWTAYLVEPPPGDLKLLWEPSRFAWVFPLSSAYRLTGEDRYAEGCWRLIESWRAANRPNAGPHWASAQESAVRILALTFALHALEPWLAGEPARVAALAQMVAVHARRIPPTLGYARSLRNNHLVTEAVGLYTAGAAFPEFRQAARWRSLGRRRAIAALGEQILADGGHIQHSLNYHRQVLEAGLWAAHLAEIEGARLPGSTLQALRRAAELLGAVVDPATGQVPNLGANDGGRLLPAAGCGFADFRPTLQVAACLCGSGPLPPGPWDETAAWLGRSLDRRQPAHPPAEERSDFPAAGLYLAGGQENRGLFRCARFMHRPGHADQLHLELRWHGVALARDPGSYLYNAPPPWDNALAKAEAHNTVLVDGQEPMRRAGPFLWLDWAQARLLGRWGSPGGALEVLAGEHDGYDRLGVIHRRTVVRAGDDVWLVVDDLLGAGEHSARAVWQLPDAASPQLRGDALSLAVAGGYAVIQMEIPGDLFAGPVLHLGLHRAGARIAGESDSPPAETWGWWSPTYAVRQPALTLVGETRGALPMRILTWWTLGSHGQESLEVSWRTPGRGPAAAARLSFEGELLEIGA